MSIWSVWVFERQFELVRDLRAWRIRKASSDFERGQQDWSLMHHQLGFVDLFNTLNRIPFHRDPEGDVRWRRITPCEDYISLLFIVLIVVLLFIQNNSYFKTCLPRPKLGPVFTCLFLLIFRMIKGWLLSLAAIHQIAVVICWVVFSCSWYSLKFQLSPRSP